MLPLLPIKWTDETGEHTLNVCHDSRDYYSKYASYERIFKFGPMVVECGKLHGRPYEIFFGLYSKKPSQRFIIYRAFRVFNKAIKSVVIVFKNVIIKIRAKLLHRNINFFCL